MKRDFHRVYEQTGDEIRQLTQWVQRGDEKKNSLDDDLNSFTLYDRFLSNFYFLKNKEGLKSPEVKRLVSKVQYFTLHLLSSQRDKRGIKASKSFLEIYKDVWKDNLYRFYLVLSIFIISCLIGFQVGIYGDDYVLLLLPQDFMEMIQNRYSWFEKLREDPFEGVFSIAFNNISVAIKTFFNGCHTWSRWVRNCFLQRTTDRCHFWLLLSKQDGSFIS